MKRYHFLLCMAAALCTMSLNVSASGGTAKTDTPSASAKSASASAKTEETGIISEDAVPYKLRLDGTVSIFDGPGYDNTYARVVGRNGVYTIVEEKQDEEENLWGRLKSGVGWVDLTDIQSVKEEPAPVTACFAEELLLNGGDYSDYPEYLAEDSEYIQKIAFRANEPLTDVTLTSMELTEDSLKPAEELYTIDKLPADSLFVAGVVFYGDSTSYGITFTDSEDNICCYVISVSGRNGALVLTEQLSWEQIPEVVDLDEVDSDVSDVVDLDE